jgi:hypothetical protein
MSREHHLVRNFVVREMPIAGKPLSPVFIAQKLDLPFERTKIILDELEKHMTFLFRDEQGAVIWAYPVTVERTPHRLTFSTGEQLYAAWAIDAMASPFVQGRLRAEPLSVAVRTECALCGQSMGIEIDSELRSTILDGGTNPLIFHPFIDFDSLAAPSIIDDFWRKSVFFCSEEHAGEMRAKTSQMDGNYYTLDQCASLDRMAQSALFAFNDEGRGIP